MGNTGNAGAYVSDAGGYSHRNGAWFLSGRLAHVATLLSLAIAPFCSLQAATPVRFAGAVSGLVMDSLGKPQPGASVALLNQQERLLQRVYTDLAGNFSFGDLLPDLYSIQVSLSSFVPASRDHVLVRPGMRSLIEVNLSKMFSSIHVVSTVPAPGGLMSDDWKWTLRSDPSLRPILRLLPDDPGASTAGLASAGSPTGGPATTIAGGTKTAVFHDSSALVRLSASDTAITDAAADEADLGTQFAFATSVYSNNQFHLSGDVGYASATGQPAAALRTTYSREIAGDTPSVSVTMRQMNAAARVGQNVAGGAGEGNLPTLRTLSVSVQDKTQLSDVVSIQYGSELDTISFLDHLQYFSPWAKLTFALPRGHLDMVFTSGNAHPGLESQNPGDALQNELSALALLPRLSEMDGHIRAQRGDDYEIGYSDVVGPMEYRISAYHQYVANTTLAIANPDANLFSGDLLPSVFASSALFDAGNISTSGYTVSATRNLTPNYRITVSYGTLGVMTPVADASIFPDAQSLREAITTANRRALTLRSSGTVRHVGTRYAVSYEFTDLKAAVPMASFSTQPDRSEPGLNLALRQPIPFIPFAAGHIEATAEIRNLLAQGYLPLSLTDGQQILVVNAPRVFRGGLAFVF
jgi:hypothetical protein